MDKEFSSAQKVSNLVDTILELSQRGKGQEEEAKSAVNEFINVFTKDVKEDMNLASNKMELVMQVIQPMIDLDLIISNISQILKSKIENDEKIMKIKMELI